MNLPAISFVMPARNALPYIDEALRALANAGQAHSWELIVVDDNSSDRTHEVASGFSERLPQIRVVRNEGTGKIDALNTGFRHARADVLKFIDADDVLLDEYFALPAPGPLEATCHDATITDEEGGAVAPYAVQPAVVHAPFDEVLRNFVAPPRWTWTVHRTLAEHMFPLPVELPFEDVWFALAIKRFASRISYAPVSCYLYRQHGSQTYGGILNFAPERVTFRANRLLRLIKALEKNAARLGMDTGDVTAQLDEQRRQQTLLAAPSVSLGTIRASTLPAKALARVVLLKRLNWLAAPLAKTVWWWRGLRR